MRYTTNITPRNPSVRTGAPVPKLLTEVEYREQRAAYLEMCRVRMRELLQMTEGRPRDAYRGDALVAVNLIRSQIAFHQMGLAQLRKRFKVSQRVELLMAA